MSTELAVARKFAAIFDFEPIYCLPPLDQPFGNGELTPMA